MSRNNAAHLQRSTFSASRTNVRKLLTLFLMLAAAAGCSRHHGVDTGRLADSFQSADPALKVEAHKVIATIKAGHLPEALAQLERLGRRAKLPAEQQQAIQDLITQIQTQIEQATPKAAADAQKAAPKKP
jgi:hypothetical protein